MAQMPEAIILRKTEETKTGVTYCMADVKTNADRIRAMTDEELVEIFANNDCGYCRIHDFCFAKGNAINCDDVWLEWLKEEKNNVCQ